MLAIVFYALDASAQRRRNTRVAPLTEDATIRTLPIDSISSDSLALDSVPQRQETITAPVDFEASDSIVFTQNGFAHLYGESKVTYEQINLAADVISMNIDSTTVFAYGREDSLGTVKGKPVFTEGDTPYETNQIRYNFNSKKGVISNIVTMLRKVPTMRFTSNRVFIPLAIIMSIHISTCR